MEFSKKTWKNLFLVITGVLLIAFGLRHIDVVASAVSAVLSLLSPIFLGICIAFVVNIPMRALESLWNRLFLGNVKQVPLRKGDRLGVQLRRGLRRPVCMVVSLLLITGLLCAVVFMLFPQLGRAFRDFADMLPGYLEKLERLWGDLQTMLYDFGFVLPDFAIDVSKLNADGILNTAKNFFAQWGTHILDTTVSITTSVFSGVFNVVLALVFSVYMLSQKEELCYQLRRILRALFSERRVEKLCAFADLVNRTFTNFITGQLTEAVIIGVLCGIGMVILQIPYALVVSVIVGFTALIPVFGAYVGTGIGAFLILLAEPVKALWFVIFIIVLQQVEGNLIYPRVVGKSVGLPGLLVLAAVTVGSGIGGILGMLLAVPVCSVIFTVCAQAVDARLAQKNDPSEDAASVDDASVDDASVDAAPAAVPETAAPTPPVSAAKPPKHAKKKKKSK